MRCHAAHIIIFVRCVSFGRRRSFQYIRQMRIFKFAPLTLLLRVKNNFTGLFGSSGKSCRLKNHGAAQSNRCRSYFAAFLFHCIPPLYYNPLFTFIDLTYTAFSALSEIFSIAAAAFENAFSSAIFTPSANRSNLPAAGSAHSFSSK